MRFIVDTNIMFSGLIKDSIIRKILLSPKFDFYIPDYFSSELNKYIFEIIEKASLMKNELEDLVNIFLKKICLVPIDEYKRNLKKGIEFIGVVDEKNIPFIALALSTKNDGIWTNDKHFKKHKKIEIFSTKDLIKLL